MAFDWERFFKANNIYYSTHNVSRGQAAIHCPFCGSEDESEHLSVSLEGKGWRCWRKPKDHYGKSPVRLVMALLQCSQQTAMNITGTSTFLPDDFMGTIEAALVPPPPPKRARLRLPDEFKAFKHDPGPIGRRFFDYLVNRRRGFTREQVHDLIDMYDMRYCTRGPNAGRIMFPIYYRGELVTWTGRTIYPSAELRYKTLSIDPDKAHREGYEPAIGPITDYLFFYDHLRKVDADTILLNEGPLDVLKVRVLGEPHGVTATCFFTSSPTSQQIDLLHELLPRFRRRLLLLDRETLPTALQVQGALSGLDVEIGALPPSCKDPGEICDWRELRSLRRAELSRRRN